MRSYARTLTLALTLSACAHGTVVESLLESKEDHPSCPAGGGGGAAPVEAGGAGGGAGSAGAGGSAGSAGSGGDAGGSGGSHAGGSGGSGPVGCDAAGDCGACGDCALNGGACNAEANACGADPSCTSFYDCVAACADQACFDACGGQYPQGEALYLAFVSCVVCGECPASCGGC